MNIRKVLHINRVEARAIFVLISYSFFMGLSIAFYFTSTISEFLINFDIKALPHTYILSGILGYLLWFIWSKLEKRIRFTSRLRIGISFLFISVLLLALGMLVMDNKWVSFVMLVWVRVFVFVNMVNFWGIAGKLFNLSQGKRLFGIISIGAVISDLIGFFSIPLIISFGIPNTGLIFISLITLVLCVLMTFHITKVFKKRLADSSSNEKDRNVEQQKEPFFKSKYHAYLFLLAILPMFGFYFVDYLFLDQIKIRYSYSADAMAGFMGVFFGVVALCELLIKTTVFSRLIYDFGIKVTLLVLPGILLISVVLTITAGLFAGSFGFLFAMIAFIKLLEKGLRSGVNDPSFQILYQPIPSEERLALQSKMEGVPTALGNVAAGVLLLILIHTDLTDPLVYNSIFLVVLIFWCYMSYKMYYEYREVVVNNLSGLQRDNKYQDNQKSGIIAEFKGVRRLLLSQYLNMSATFNRVPDLLKRSSDDVREIFNTLMAKYQLFEYGPFVGAIAGMDNTHSQADTLSTSHSSSAADLVKGAKRIKFSRPVPLENKLIALNRLSTADISSDHLKEIEAFLKDKNPGIVQGALMLIPLPLSLKYGEMLIHAMESMPLSHLAIPLFKQKDVRLEKLVIKKLQQIESIQWSDMNGQLLSLQLVKILKKFGGTDAKNHLVKTLQFSNSEMKYFASYALADLKFKADEDQKFYFAQMIEKEVSFCTWLLACISDLGVERNEMKELISSLETEFEQSRDKIYIYLSFIYPENTILQIKENLQSTSTEKYVLGIEMCEMVLKPELRSMLIPLFMNSSNSEKLRLLNKEFPQQNLSPFERLANISYYDFTRVNTWIKILSMHLISKMDQGIPKEVIANTYINNPTIKESAYLAIRRLNSDIFVNRIENESHEYRQYFDRLVGKDRIRGKSDSTFKLINKLKSFDLFRNIYEGILMKIAFYLFKVKLVEGNELSVRYGYDEYIHFIYKGGLTLKTSDSGEEVIFEKGSISGLFEPFNLRDTDFRIHGKTELLVIEAPIFFKLVSIYDDLSNTLYKKADSLEPKDDLYFYTS